MKIKTILTALLLSIVTCVNAQITLEHTYTTDQPNQILKLTTKLSLSGTKYVSLHKTGLSFDYFVLYNSNHTVFKTIQVPQLAGWWVNCLDYISETLFNSDSLVEYLVSYSSGANNQTYVYDENGTILLQEPNGWWVEGITNFAPPIFSVGGATKLVIGIGAQPNFTSTKVYSLPGQLTCDECSNGVISAIASPLDNQIHKETSIPYPNPSADVVKIKYSLPENYHKAFIDIFDITGQHIKQMQIDKTFNEITLSNEDLSSGAYFYSIVVDDKVLEKNKYIVVK